MTRHFDTSAIPDDPAYWDMLAARVACAAKGRRSTLGWMGGRSERRLVLAALSAAAAMLIVALAVRSAPPRRSGDAWTAALAPRDPLGRLLVRATVPPPVAAIAVSMETAPGGAR